MEYFNRFGHQCVSTPSYHHQIKLRKKRNSGNRLLILLLLTVTVFTQMTRPCTAASVPQLEDTSLEPSEFSEDTSMFNIVKQISRFIRRKDDFEREKILHKRHNNNAHEALSTNDDKPDWQNICGFEGDWSGDEIPDELNRDYVRLYMKTLRRSVNVEYKTLKCNGLHDIDIDDMRAWRLHERRYKFLPTLDHNSPISPACWHQGVQTYIASFAYLYKIQKQLDHQHYRTHNRLTREIKAMLQSSKRVLCEIETNIRGTFPSDKRQLKLFTSEEMLTTLNFYTNENTRRNVDHTDLRFSKFFYQNYLFRISELLSHYNKNSHMQLQYTCEQHKHHMILVDTNLNTVVPNLSNESDNDADE